MQYLRSSIVRVVIIAVLVLGCSNSPAVEFTGDASWEYLLAQCEFGPRVPGTPAHDSTRTFIVSQLKRAGAKVSLQRFTVDDPYSDGELKLTNIIGSFTPDNKKRVLLAAHYDTRPWADEEPDAADRAKPIIGANDGASGVAVLLEIADIIAEQAPEVGVDLVFFDGEDYGKKGSLEHYLLGSRYFAANLGGYRPVCGILLDMVGSAKARILREANSSAQAGDLTAELFQRAKKLGLTVFVDEPGQAVYDDHIPLLTAGIPMVDLIDFPNPYWHTLQDTPQICSQETLRQVGTLVIDFLYRASI